jgi:alkylated DNA nucleotide flippase Atl1
VLEGFVGRSEYANSGRRVVSGQRLMQATSDSFLGWQRVQGFDGRTRDFYIRQLHDWKGAFEVEQMVPIGLAVYARLCGWTLARAHARSGDRIAIAAYLGAGDTFDTAVATFASLYADQNERDHAALAAAVSAGQVTAVSGL